MSLEECFPERAEMRFYKQHTQPQAESSGLWNLVAPSCLGFRVASWGAGPCLGARVSFRFLSSHSKAHISFAKAKEIELQQLFWKGRSYTISVGDITL